MDSTAQTIHDTVALSSVPSHKVATALMSIIDQGLDAIGLSKDPKIEEAIYICLIIAIAFGIGWIISWLIVLASRKLAVLHQSSVGKLMLEQKTLSHCAHIIPPLVIMSLVPFAFVAGDNVPKVINEAALIYFLITLAIAINSILNLIWTHYNRRDNTKNLPLKGVLNIGKGIVWGITVIISLSILMDKSPVALLTGLGAFAAALMLIFKDSIVGFVAGLQLANNDMLRVGDWIVVPSTPANGNVIDVSLSVVKILNWDMTTVMLPPYTLVSTSFQNYRSMQEKGIRRIDVNYLIEPESIKNTDDAFLDKIAQKYPLMSSFIDNLRKNDTKYADHDGTNPVNGTIETNLGLFRAYLCAFLNNDPQIAHDQQVLIRITDCNYQGYSLNVYCFTATSHWTMFEAIKSRVMEHIATSMEDFGLIYSYSGSYDIALVNAQQNQNAQIESKKQPALSQTPAQSLPSTPTQPDGPAEAPKQA